MASAPVPSQFRFRRLGPRQLQRLFLAAGLGLLLLLSSCIRIYSTDPPVEEAPAEGQVEVEVPIRAHLVDGGAAVFRDGARVGPERIEGSGWRYDLTRLDSAWISGITMDSVVGLESIPTSHLTGPATFLLSVGAAAVTAVGTVALLKALFGSCPTVYAADGDTEVLEAELFSYSIAPLLEGRDVDALGARASASGTVRLNVRNEALETHLVNHLQLLEVAHGPDERVLPDERELPVAVAGLAPPAAARDRGGRDVAAELAAADGVAYETPMARLSEATMSDLEDGIELVFAPVDAGRLGAGADTVALVLRLRNSLLNTVLFYDLMLAARGADALTWLAGDLERIGPAVALGQWWTSRMGLRVELPSDGGWKEVARVPDTGPIAWNELAVPLMPPAPGDSVRVRLRFVADAWRIDRAALATSVRRPEVVRHTPARLLDADDRPQPDGAAAVASPDERYLETRPGDRYAIEFDVGAEPEVGTRSFLLSSQGYYTEWIRPSWVRDAAGDPPEPGDALLREAMRRWAGHRTDFEREFFESRIPTR